MTILPLTSWLLIALLILLLVVWLVYRRKRQTNQTFALVVVGREDSGELFTLRLSRPWYLRWLALPAFQAGQSVLLGLPNEMTKRRYSLVHWQKKLRSYELAIKCEQQGYFSPRLSAYAQLGRKLFVSSPSGHFVLPPHSRHGRAVMIAGGIGITPLLAMVEQWLATRQPYRELYLYWQVRHEQDAIYQNRLMQLSHPDLHIRILVSQPHYQQAKRLNLKMLQDELGSLHASDFYLCAGTQFLDSLIAMLQNAGVHEDALFYERFSLAAGVIEGCNWNVEYAGHCFAFSGYRNLLEACEAQQLPMKSDCRSGYCGCCLTRIAQGEVEYHNKPEYNIPQGYALSCCAVPKSHIRLIKG